MHILPCDSLKSLLELIQLNEYRYIRLTSEGLPGLKGMRSFVAYYT